MDSELVFMSLQELLGSIAGIEGPARRIGARPGVVAPDDQVTGPVVLADDGVPERLAGSPHAHREWQQREHGGSRRVTWHDRLVAPHPGGGVDVSWPGHADHRVDEELGMRLAGRAHGQFQMRPVQRVSCLERDNAAPSLACERRSELGRSVT
jgi:hypothetical protein